MPHPTDPLDPSSDRGPRVARTLDALRRHSELAGEFRAAAAGVADGPAIVDEPRFALAVLGVVAFAARVWCTPSEVRRVVAQFVAETLDPLPDDTLRDQGVQHAVGVVDALYLRLGENAFHIDPTALRRAVLELLIDDGH